MDGISSVYSRSLNFISLYKYITANSQGLGNFYIHLLKNLLNNISREVLQF